MFYINKYYHFLIRKLLDLYNLVFTGMYRKISLERTLKYCSENIGFYKNRGYDIGRYDFIDNNTVRNKFDQFVKKGINTCNPGYTSGTTGMPCKYLRDIRSIAVEQYCQSKYFAWNGKFKVIFRGERLFGSGENPDKIFKTVPFIREMHVSSFHINDSTLKPLVAKLKKIPNKCLWAYPSSAYLLAEYCIRNGEKLEFDMVATSSEKILDYQVETMEKAFNCRVKDWYGQAERVSALYRCDFGHYHETENYSYVEYIPQNDNTFEIVGTTLHNRIMPLVRYKTRDTVEISPQPCPCGGKGVNVSVIHGRPSSFIELHGVKIPECLLSCLIKKTKNIIEFQVIQTKQKNIIYRVVKSESFSSEDEALLLNTIYGTLPREYCTIESVDRIERDKSGKFRCVINENLIM